MSERSPLFLGLMKPAKTLGLPIGYLVILIVGSALPFIWSGSFYFLIAGALAYPFLWFAAEKEPRLFELLHVSLGKVQPTKNRKHWGGDSFGS